VVDGVGEWHVGLRIIARVCAETSRHPSRHRAPAGRAIGQWRWLVPVTIVAATAAWVVGAVSGSVHGGQRAGLIVIGAVLTAVAVGAPLWQQHRASLARSDAVDAARAARAAMRVALEDTLDPFVHLVGQLARAKAADKPRLQGEAIQLAVTTTAALAGPDRVRVCFFVLDPGPPRTLRPERFAGRAGAPTVALTEGTSAGTAALRMLDRGSWTFIDDTNRYRPRFWWDVEPAYRTLLAGPVAAHDTVFGLLTMDALVPGELAQVDLVLVRLLADLLATALCV
jgi:hypothetical protein